MSKLVGLIFILFLVAVSIMFDWFGARDLAQEGLNYGQKAINDLNETGNKVNDAIDSIDELTRLAKEK
jgi:hypothetical protein